MSRTNLKYLSVVALFFLNCTVYAADSKTASAQQQEEKMKTNLGSSVIIGGIALSYASLYIRQSALPAIPGIVGGVAAAAPAGVALVGAGGVGYFVGEAMVIADKIYLDGWIMDNVVGPTLSLPFKGIYTVQQWMDARSEARHILSRP